MQLSNGNPMLSNSLWPCMRKISLANFWSFSNFAHIHGRTNLLAGVGRAWATKYKFTSSKRAGHNKSYCMLLVSSTRRASAETSRVNVGPAVWSGLAQACICQGAGNLHETKTSPLDIFLFRHMFCVGGHYRACVLPEGLAADSPKIEM